MLRRRTLQIAIASFAALTLARALAAQGRPPAAAMRSGVELGLAGGSVFPTGALRDAFTVGYTAGVILGFNPVGLPFGMRLEVGRDRLRGRATEEGDPDQRVWRASLAGIAKLAGRATAPYVTGGVGVYHLAGVGTNGRPPAASGSATRLGASAGAGIGFHPAWASAFVEGAYHALVARGSRSGYVTARVGVSVDVGGAAARARPSPAGPAHSP